ncbi:MAG TPA: M23 family metallopeptidase [Thermoanaerobaculia bacterium]|nr:M23 family metallopeptidase [Thermoanaerobaculia bacterium]
MKSNEPGSGSRKLFRCAAWALPLLLSGGVAFEISRLERIAGSPFPITPAPHFSPITASAADALPGLDDLLVPQPHSVARGQTLLRVFEELGLESEDARVAASAATEHLDPRRLRAGERFSAYFGSEGSVARVVFEVHQQGRVEVARSSGGWQSEWRPYRLMTQQRVLAGALAGGFEASVEAAGGPAMVAYRLADVFQWDLDFNRDLRLGDRFAAVYAEVRADGRFQRVGEIEAAVYENQGRLLQAYRFGEGGAYYDGEGRPLRKQFLRSPLEFSRVTSGFSHRRFHPVLKTYRPHYGVDYGAPTGTPVRVTASGVVVSAAWNDGGGRMVVVRHPNSFQTSYLHLSRFADGVRGGARVTQGQVIGFVGSTGLATAAHLDYRVRQNGRYIDPLSVRNEPAPPLMGASLERFFVVRDRLREELSRAPSPMTSLDVGPLSVGG